LGRGEPQESCFVPGGRGYVALAATGGTMSPVQIRPVGGTAGCLVMILISIVASVLLTLVLNVLLR
jgi:hypothetical protein